MSLPKTHRLRLRHEFNAVYQKGKRRRSTHLTLLALPHYATCGRSTIVADSAMDEAGAVAILPTRVGISISQKVSKRAVVRNRIKRQLKAVFRQLLPQFPTGWDLVVVVQPQAIQCDYEQFLQELKQLLVNAEVLHGY